MSAPRPKPRAPNPQRLDAHVLDPHAHILTTEVGTWFAHNHQHEHGSPGEGPTRHRHRHDHRRRSTRGDWDHHATDEPKTSSSRPDLEEGHDQAGT